MAIVRQGFSGNGQSAPKEGNGVTSLVLDKPTGLADGDVLLMCVAVGGSGTPASTGFTLRSGGYVGTAVFMHFLTKVITNAAGEPSTYTVNGWASSRATAWLVRYSGVDTTNIWDIASPSKANNSNALTVVVGQITTVTDGAMMVGLACQNSSTGSISVATMTEISESTGTGRRASINDEARATAGATGSRTFTFNASNLEHAGMLDALRPAASDQTITVNQTTETDTAQVVTVVKAPLTITVNQTTETDTAQVVTPVKTIIKLVGQTTETDAPQSATVVKAALSATVNQTAETDAALPVARNVGRATEADLAQPIAAIKAKIVTVNQASETDLAQTVTPIKAPQAVIAGQTIETDTIQPVAPWKYGSVGQAAETDASQVMVRLKTATLGQLAETDLAQAVSPSGPKVRPVNQTTETDTAQVVTPVKTIIRLTGLDLEVDLAQAITPVKAPQAVIAGQTLESDASQVVTPVKAARTIAAGQTQQTDVAQGVLAFKPITVQVAQALSVESALAALGGMGPQLGKLASSVNDQNMSTTSAERSGMASKEQGSGLSSRVGAGTLSSTDQAAGGLHSV